jgi:alcohol-forming fatty acyl-CoA reductase
MNIIGVKKMLDLAKKMKNLEVFVHVSTAYANCDRQHISEVVYNPSVQPDKLLEAVDWMEEDLMKLLTPKIIQFRPNTYTYTKAIAENLVIQAEKDIPFAIVRPSIVGASWREPFSGWIDNYNGPTALFVACGKGILRTMLGNKNAIADIVPVDIPVNLMIATAWFRGSAKTKQTIVYNCSTGQINCLKWGVVERVLNTCIIKNPYEKLFWVPAAGFTVSKINKYLGIFFTQLLPSFLVDVYLRIANKKPM